MSHGQPMRGDRELIDQLRLAVYAHFPARDIRAFEELLRRYAARNEEIPCSIHECPRQIGPVEQD